MPNTARNSPTTVLYAARDSMARTLLSDALRKAGLNLREAATGSEALASVDPKPDLIILDVNLADLSGFEVCRRLKVDPNLATIPVLLISGRFAEEAERLRALAAGADDYLLEPVDPAELLNHIEALLLAQQSEQSDGSSEASAEDS